MVNFTCPHCRRPITIDLHDPLYAELIAAIRSDFGKQGGSVTSDAKTKAAKLNAAKPPRPGSNPRGRPKSKK